MPTAIPPGLPREWAPPVTAQPENLLQEGWGGVRRMCWPPDKAVAEAPKASSGLWLLFCSPNWSTGLSPLFKG